MYSYHALLLAPCPPVPSGFQCVVLTKVWRQSDQEFVRLLNAIRFGDNNAAAHLARTCGRPLPEREGIKPTQVGSRAGRGGAPLHAQPAAHALVRAASSRLKYSSNPHRPMRNLCCHSFPPRALMTCVPSVLLQLFPRNADVDRVNSEELARLPGGSVVCEAQDEVQLAADAIQNPLTAAAQPQLSAGERAR